MKIVVLGGYGEIGSCISLDLSQSAKNFDVVVAGRNLNKAKALVNSLKTNNLSATMADVNDKTELKRLIKNADVLINATNYYMNLNLMKVALDCNTNYVDLGGLYHTTIKQLKLDDPFKRNDLLAVIGCGSTPGITNILAKYGAQKFDKIKSIHFQFADKDFGKSDIPFSVPYSMHTVFDEFTKSPAVFKAGRIKFVQPLSGDSAILFPKPVGSVICRYSLHSELATIPQSFSHKGISECSFMGGWDSDFINKTNFLIQAGFASSKPITIDGAKVKPRDLAVNLLNKFIPNPHTKINDLEFIRVEIHGTINGKQKKIAMYCRATTNKKYNIPAGTWDTGVPPSIIAQMIAEKRINSKGVLPPERLDIDMEEFFNQLKRRNISIEVEHLK